MPPILSRLIQKQRYHVSRSFINGDILELGCGIAPITELLQPEQSYIGIEISPKVLEWLQHNRPEYSFYRFDLEQDQINLDKQFDSILMLAVLEHLDRPDNVLRQVPRLLKPDGHLVITTPTPFGNWIHSIGVHLGLFYKAAALDHKQIYNRASLTHILEDCGLKVVYYKSFMLGGNQLCVSQLSPSTR